MNILFCENLKPGNLGTHSVHIFEVVTNLRKLGHNVVLINEGAPGRDTRFDVNRRSLWGHMRDSMLRSRILKPIRGGGVILYYFLKDIWSFLQVFIIIVRQKRRFDVIYRRDHLFNSEYLLAKFFRIPVVKEVNGIMVDEVETTERAGKVALRIIDRIDRFNLPKADKIIVVTSKLKEVLQENYGVPSDKITVIQNGADTDLFKPMDVKKAREELGLNQNYKYVCFMGAFYAWQGIDHIIRSAPLVLQKCHGTRFLIVGDGPIKQELINLAEQVGVSDKIMFTGMVSHQEVPLYINASDVCVLPKVVARSGLSPLKLYEYMACGKPVVATRVSGLDILEECRAGLLMNPEDYQEFANAVTMLLKNRELRRELGKNGRQYVVENQSWESVAQRVANVCQSLVKSRRSR